MDLEKTLCLAKLAAGEMAYVTYGMLLLFEHLRNMPHGNCIYLSGRKAQRVEYSSARQRNACLPMHFFTGQSSSSSRRRCY